MKCGGSWAIYGAMCAALACQSSIAGKPSEGNGSATGTPSTNPGSGAGSTTSTPGASVATNGGAPAASGTPSAGAGSSVAASNPATDAKPKIELLKATARTAGRYGDQLVLAVDGKASVGTLGAIEVQLLDKDGQGVVYFDTDWDGSADSAIGRVQPLEAPKTQSFSIQAVLDRVPRAATLDSLNLALYDRENRKTDALAVAVQQQAVIALGGGCDATLATNRCVESLSCSGSPAVCTAGAAPTITRAAYQRGPEGPFIRIEGQDPDGDVTSVLVDFYRADEARLSIDLDGDEQPDADHLEVFNGVANDTDGYHVLIESGLGFDTLVPRLGLTVIDSRGARSTTQLVNVSNQTVSNAGQTCDPEGFVGCGSKNTCLPINSGTSNYYCTTYTQAQTNRCGQAALWDLGKDPAKITGIVSGVGVWEPPLGCTGSSAVRPETVVKLRVPKALARLVLSTAVPETGMDTALYVLPSCTADPTTALACSDDDAGYASRIVLTDLAAGDYFVIVESALPEGGHFGISASTE